jgi:hypothetical protein
VSDQHLHIISFDVPYPPDYGGVVDIYNRIKALSQQGVKIHLHCFEYRRARAKELEQLCVEVNYYARNTSLLKLFSALPYIVCSRNSKLLLNNLLKDDHPILMEGIHTTYFLDAGRLPERRIIVRSHNIEHDYYRNLAEIEERFWRRSYFIREAKKLQQYEPVLKKAFKVAAISPDDTLYINRKYGNAFYLPAFHGNDEVSSKPGKGNYALYHGNLSVGENNFAALFLVNHIFSKTEKSLIIAGNNPSAELIQATEKYPNITLKITPDVKEMQELIQNAHINILPTFQSTGIKLKLIHALYNGRFCIVNSRMVEHTGLEQLCRITDSDQEMINAVEDKFRMEFTEEKIAARKNVLNAVFNNMDNAKRLIKVFYQ